MAQNGCPGVFEVADHDYDVQIATLTTWGSGTPTKVISVELSQNSSREGKTLGARGVFWVTQFKYGIGEHLQTPGAPQPRYKGRLRDFLDKLEKDEPEIVKVGFFGRQSRI